jgi:putative transposase
MARLRRSVVPRATYFFTVNTHLGRKMLTKPPFYQALKQSLAVVKTTHPFVIEALVPLPDHLHCIS